MMEQSSLTAPWYSKIQRPKSLKLRWRSLIGDTDEVIKHIFADTGGWQFHYGLMSLHNRCIFQPAKPEVVDAPLTLIVRK